MSSTSLYEPFQPHHLADPGLFGNAAAEDEPESLFLSYVLERPELSGFINPDELLLVARAYKGEGKSALLRHARSRLRAQDQAGAAIVVGTTRADLAPSTEPADHDGWVRAWQAGVFRLIASEVGRRLGTAWSDDGLSLYEEAERTGFRERGLITSITARLQHKSMPQTSTPTIGNYEELLKRWLSGHQTAIWVFVDDIDHNFTGEPIDRMRIASFFTAARRLVSRVPSLRMRLAVRPNTWALLQDEYETLTHVEQYMRDLNWSEDDLSAMLYRRIEAFCYRKRFEDILEEAHKHSNPTRGLIATVFDDPMRWGGKPKAPATVLTTLAWRRPRWLVELCVAAGVHASKAHNRRIDLTAIIQQLTSLGEVRIRNLVAEFRSESPNIREFISAFAGEREEYSTDELMAVISRKVLPHVRARIAGRDATDARSVAQFLYYVGFLIARHDQADGSYHHLFFKDDQSLLKSRANIDRGYRWEIHPVFRQALGLRDEQGREVRKR